MRFYAALALALPLAALAQSVPRKLPARLHQYVSSVARLSQAEYANLLDGAPVTKLLDADPTLEVAIFGAVWIDAPRARWGDLLQDIESFERGRGFRVTQRISSPPQISDFDRMQLPMADLMDSGECGAAPHCSGLRNRVSRRW